MRALLFVTVCLVSTFVSAAEGTHALFPDGSELWEVLTLRSYNTRLVVGSTSLLGMASGFIGSFLLLRKRSLMGDTLSHACLPGICIMFLIMVKFGGTGKSLPGLLFGATVTGLIGVWLVMLIRNTTRIKDDSAMGIILSVFYGLGVALITLVKEVPEASAAGLESYIYGKVGSMILQDFLLIATVTGVVLVASFLLLKEFTLLCFDDAYAGILGWNTHLLDLVLLALVTAVTVIGLQSVGLILIIAFLITPAAAARFWTDDLRIMLLLAGGIGGFSGWFGSSISALTPNLSAGALIVLMAALVFLFSMFFGKARGVLVRLRAHQRLHRKVGRQHLLRALYELLEEQSGNRMGELPANDPVPVSSLQAKRSWTPSQLRRLLRQAQKEDHVELSGEETVRLSEPGFGEAARTTRNHRLWETYLITHADVAPQHVDRDADRVEHVLGPELVRQLEEKLARDGQPLISLPSPHLITPGGAGI